MMHIIQFDTGNYVIGRIEQPEGGPVGEGWIAVTQSEYDQAQIGYHKNADGTYTPPPPDRKLLPLAFSDRFTLGELSAIEALADSDHTVRAWLRKMTLASVVHLDDNNVINGLAYLKSVGIPALWADSATADIRIAAIRA